MRELKSKTQEENLVSVDFWISPLRISELDGIKDIHSFKERLRRQEFLPSGLLESCCARDHSPGVRECREWQTPLILASQLFRFSLSHMSLHY